MRTFIPAFLILLVSLPSTGFAQKISGRVLNESGLAASSVTVQFKNKSNTVLTNADGSFTIIAKKLPDTLVFSAVGFEPYKVVVTEKTVKDPNFEIVLLNKRKTLSEVAMVAGEKKYDRDGVTIGYSSADKGLEGKVRGVDLSSPMRIRGTGYTTTGGYITNKKLFMIDSMPAKKDSVVYSSGLLTAGEINDFNKWQLWEDYGDNSFKAWGKFWNIYTKSRYCVQLQNKDHGAVVGQKVFLINKTTKDTAWSAITDNTGKAELWANMKEDTTMAEYVISCSGYKSIESPSVFANGVNKLEINIPCKLSNAIDIAFAVDATGSMGDEIEFLKLELEDVVRKTFAEYNDLDLRVGSVFYRDIGDDYLTKHIDLQTDLLKVLNFIKLQKASGGGDQPEAVHNALKTALDSLNWNEDARARILFLVLDAPPHEENKEDIFNLMRQAAAKGVRIVPVVCSGADKSTEFIMRSMALATNGTYLFLTDNSSIGLGHEKPTTDFFNVEFLTGLMQRVIKQMVFANKCSQQEQPETFRVIPPNVEKVKVYPNPTSGNITVESKNPLKAIFISDFTGKILMRIETGEKQTKWNINIGNYPNATYLLRYITNDDRWGAERIVLIH